MSEWIDQIKKTAKIKIQNKNEFQIKICTKVSVVGVGAQDLVHPNQNKLVRNKVFSVFFFLLAISGFQIRIFIDIYN